MPLPRGFKAEANRIALRVRHRMGLCAVDPLNPFEVCRQFDITVMSLSELDDDSPFLKHASSAFSAMTVPCGFNTAIVHNDSHHEYRQNSNICHELAHCFLGHECTPPLTKNGERTRDGGVEEQANFLAGALLIPNEAALHIISNGLIAQAQRLYGVSESMLTYRLRVSGAQKIHHRRLGLPA